MKRIMAVLAVAVMCGTGCASYLGTRMTATEIRAAQPQNLAVGVNFADPDYWTAWGKHPWLMTGATAIDLGTAYYAFTAIKDAVEDDPASGGRQDVPTMQISNDGGTQTIIINGGTATSSQTWTEGGGE